MFINTQGSKLLFQTFPLAVCALLFIGGPLFSQDDLYKEIEKGLEAPKASSTKVPYLLDFAHAFTQPKNYTAYKEVYLSGRYSFDLGKVEGRNSLGFLLFGTFSGSEGQLGDLNVQGRVAYYNNQFSHGKLEPREYTRKINQLKLELHNAFLRSRVFPPYYNVRVGHFYAPFGLQPWIDTHGTLLQGPAMSFIGMERDWGVAVDGQGGQLEYEVGLTRGSGMEYFQREKNFTLSGKLSTARIGEHVNDWVGLSYLVGRVSDRMAAERLHLKNIRHNIIPRWRLGMDGQKIFGPTRVRYELTGGQDAGKADLMGEFLELKYALGKKGRWDSYFQFENLNQLGNKISKGADTTVRAGLTYIFSANYNLQFVLSKDVRVIRGKKDTWAGLLLYGQL